MKTTMGLGQVTFKQSISWHSSARPWRVNFVFGQVPFQFTYLGGQVNILDKTMVIKMNYGVYMWFGQVVVNS